MIRWIPTALGDFLSDDGQWRIRGPIWGKRMYWLYRNGSRYTPTGSYEDVANFTSLKVAQKFVETLTTSPEDT